MIKVNLIIFSFLSIINVLSAQIEAHDILKPVKAQLEAYNNGDIDNFLSQYSDSVKVLRYPDQLQYIGLEKMRIQYEGFFKENPNLHCKLLNRIVQGNTVIDHEEVSISKDRNPFYAIAIYKVKYGLIEEVRFLY
ncbi:MAG: SnoaL-like domain-containing protein [Saprospiraceae bacterium]|nr:nuclear transport factor 2 family protein [Bacteroidia bacterium]NNE16255.1 SnoaL-like domain-containing protein [Saprospiraceae bacterium]NNL91554.1 SnoaL-like domain-containing protein [Saprospiraceae bacterium]